MSNDKQACVICGIKLNNPIMLGEEATKLWAKKHGYDGYQWRESKESVLAVFKDIKEELLEADPHPQFYPDSVKFFTCMKHTGREFSMGEAPEDNRDREDD